MCYLLYMLHAVLYPHVKDYTGLGAPSDLPISLSLSLSLDGKSYEKLGKVRKSLEKLGKVRKS